MNLQDFKKCPVLGILRGAREDEIDPLAECLVDAGLKAVEITMNTPHAPALIRRMKTRAENRLMVGAGTVLTKTDLNQALEAGASFIVSPVFIPEIVEACAARNIPVFPGALTPQEIYQAYRAGATMVKVFPAKFFGPGYMKEIKGPLNDIELLACGGVNEENVRDFFDSGASAVAFGSSIFKREWLEAQDFDKIKEAVKRLLAKV